MKQSERVPVKAAQSTFRVIEVLKELDGAGVTEIAQHLDLPKSTVHDHLQTLEQTEYVVNNDGHYELGMRLLELGGFVRSDSDLYRVAQSEIDKLAAETGEHANLMVEEYGWGYFVYKSEGENAVWLDTHVGMRVHLQTTSMGKCILANMPREQVSEILDRTGLPQITEHSIATREELFDELDQIRERGYALDNEERVQGMRCVGAPVTGPDDEILGAVSVSGPTSRLRDDYFRNELPDMVRSAANVIEVNVTHNPLQ